MYTSIHRVCLPSGAGGGGGWGGGGGGGGEGGGGVACSTWITISARSTGDAQAISESGLSFASSRR